MKNRILTSYISIAFLLLIGVFGSCRKDIPNSGRPDDYVDYTFDQIFEGYWNGMNNNYVFWDVDTTDWDRVYREYKPKFAQLDRSNADDISTAHGYFTQISSGLVDGHYSIDFRNGQNTIFPAINRLLRRSDFRAQIPNRHFLTVIPQRYLGTTWSRAQVTIDNQPSHIVSGTISNDIIYLRFSDFNVEVLYNNSASYQATFDHFLENIQRIATPKGLILDLRGNPGGYLDDIHFVLGNLIAQRHNFGFSKVKSNNNRLDYSPLIPSYITPQPNAITFSAPIVVLSDQYSASMSEITSLAVKSLPNGHFIGETTFGAMGPLTGNVILNGGQFQTTYLSSVTTSSSQFLSLDKVSYEGRGVPPDQAVTLNVNSLQSGDDTQLNAAIDYISAR